MKRKILCGMLAGFMLFSLLGCSRGPFQKPDDFADASELTDAPVSVPETTETVPPATVPEDGNPEDVTCKGSYTGSGKAKDAVATVQNISLTNEELAVWYWAAVAQHRESGCADQPDYTQPLDTQVCPVDASVRSWQQYFLKQALDAWHTSQALMIQARQEPLVYEAAYQPNAKNHANNVVGKPATKFLYGYQARYGHNTMHQGYLDAIPQTLEQMAADSGLAGAAQLAETAFGTSLSALTMAVQAYNEAYMYLTFLGYDLAPTQEQIEAQLQADPQAYEISGSYADFRHILLIPEGTTDAHWQVCQEEAEELLDYWMKKTKETEATFAELAYRNSQDAGTAHRGGGYFGIRKGQLCPELDAWVFDAARVPGDTEILRTELGIHLVYFCGTTPIREAKAKADVQARLYDELAEKARANAALTVQYGSIVLPPAEGTVSFSDLLYPDVAHERYPEVPLYLQQDYPHTKFGGYKITTNGCGITTFSMLNTYMTDEEHTPPEMCAEYGRYSFSNGTDGMIFIYEPPIFGYFLREKTYDPNVAKQALIDGYIVISIQHKGYWTSGGHYILLEKMLEDGRVQVRDSNLANYSKIKSHMEDAHTWGSITGAGSGYWIFEPKQVRTNACSRCGTPDALTEALLLDSYLCPKCENAMVRRNAYLGNPD